MTDARLFPFYRCMLRIREPEAQGRVIEESRANGLFPRRRMMFKLMRCDLELVVHGVWWGACLHIAAMGGLW